MSDAPDDDGNGVLIERLNDDDGDDGDDDNANLKLVVLVGPLKIGGHIFRKVKVHNITILIPPQPARVQSDDDE